MQSVIQLSRVWFSIALLCASYGMKLSLDYLPGVWGMWLPRQLHYEVVQAASQILFLLSVYGVMASLVNSLTYTLRLRYQKRAVWGRLLSLSRVFKLMILLLIANQGIPLLDVSDQWKQMLHQGVQVLTTGMCGWCVFELIQAGEVILLHHYLPNGSRDSVDARRRYTHIAVIKRILVLLLSIITIAVMLMTFEKIRAAGTAILASAGVLATVVTFSARGLLENIFKGIQLVIAQPVRLEDTVTINGEMGTVTSITLHHVVITLSDRSQLIVPTGDLLDKVFKNWTHSSDDLVGNVLFYTRYNVPIALVRKKFYECLKSSALWDQEIGELHISELKNSLMELKFIMSAKTGKELSALRNEILEKLLEYMQQEHPQCLP